MKRCLETLLLLLCLVLGCVNVPPPAPVMAVRAPEPIPNPPPQSLLQQYDRSLCDAIGNRLAQRLENELHPNPGRVVVSFKLLPDGTLRDWHIAEHTGTESLALACELAVREAAPFRSWPEAMHKTFGDYRQLGFAFECDPMGRGYFYYWDAREVAEGGAVSQHASPLYVASKVALHEAPPRSWEPSGASGESSSDRQESPYYYYPEHSDPFHCWPYGWQLGSGEPTPLDIPIIREPRSPGHFPR